MELRTITKEELTTILEKHRMWLNDEEGGERADLEGADLQRADLGENNVRVYNFPEYNCYRSNNYFRAGCQIHTIEEWKNFTEAQIRNMDGNKAWKFYNEVLLKIIDL